MLLTFLCLVVIGPAMAGLFDPDWDNYWGNYKSMFGKNYGETDDPSKLLLYQTNYGDIMNHNQGFGDGLYSYNLRENPFSDMSPDDFEENMMGYGADMEAEEEPLSTYSRPKNFSLPKSIDWRKLGYVSHVRSQGSCKSCWAFAATGALEGQVRKKLGRLINLSEQNLIDCSLFEGNKGCSRGLTTNAYVYVKKNGINSEAFYPLVGKRGECRFNPRETVTGLEGYARIPEGDEEVLMYALANIGPIAVAINGKHSSFRHYGGGIYDIQDCDPTKVNHAMLLVGYGTDKHGRDYWIVKNSWGKHWGYDGYIHIARNRNNMCGIATRATYPLI